MIKTNHFNSTTATTTAAATAAAAAAAAAPASTNFTIPSVVHPALLRVHGGAAESAA